LFNFLLQGLEQTGDQKEVARLKEEQEKAKQRYQYSTITGLLALVKYLQEVKHPGSLWRYISTSWKCIVPPLPPPSSTYRPLFLF